MTGLSLGHGSDEAAERWLYEVVRPLGVPGLIACTHLVRHPYPHVAISLSRPLPTPVVTPPSLAAAAEAAAADHAARRAGRAVLYPGVDRLVGTLAVAELLAASAIERVILLGGADADPATTIDTRDFVRPHWRNGELTLITTPAGPGRIAPFELPDPRPCCADHAPG